MAALVYRSYDAVGSIGGKYYLADDDLVVLGRLPLEEVKQSASPAVGIACRFTIAEAMDLECHSVELRL
jgi:hypothetical protein